MSQGIHLDPKKTPANTGFPPTVDELLRFIAENMEVKGLNNINGIQVQEAKPSNTNLPWLSTNSVGKPLGMFKFYNSIWTSVEHEKGDYKYQNLTGTIHPHWRIADDTINPGPINGVTIPTVTDRGLKAAASGGKYAVGDLIGSDTLDLAHTHDVNALTSNNHTLTIAQIPAHNHKYDNAGGQAGDPPEANANTNTGKNNDDTGSTGGGQAHSHGVPAHATQSSLSAVDTRSLAFGARLLIYVGVE